MKKKISRRRPTEHRHYGPFHLNVRGSNDKTGEGLLWGGGVLFLFAFRCALGLGSMLLFIAGFAL